jgi:TolA-binding protein
MTKQVPLWTLIVASTLAILLLCGFSGALASQPEPEVITKTRTVEKNVVDKSQDRKIDSLNTQIDTLNSQLDTCQESVRMSTQAFVDVTLAFVKLGEGASNFSVDQVNEATAMIEAIDSEAVGTQAKECDPDIQSKITGLEGF